MPLVWITIMLIYGLLTKNPKRRKIIIAIVLGMVLFFGNEFIINKAFNAWEVEPKPLSSYSNYEYGIVLTGITNTETEIANDRVFFGKGADRLLHTVQLYKLGKIKKILITGGAASIVSKPVFESEQLKKVFLYCGVPENDLIIENQARNTRENAVFTKKLIDSLGLKGKFLLITSAFHMRRSEGCFKKVGLQFDTFPVDIYTSVTKYTPNHILIPSESAFDKWSILIHEVIGYVVYKVMGYC